MSTCLITYNNRTFANEELLDAYLKGNEEVGTEAPLQETSYATLPPKASAGIIKKVREFLKRIGVDVQSVRQLTDGQGNILDANAQADLLRNIISIVEGKEDVAITEEAMHFAVEILEQTNPKLLNEMLNKVDNYEIYKQVVASPIYRKQYTLPDGKINVRAMKKEAVGKILAETYIRANEDSIESDIKLSQAKDWWSKVKEFFKKLFLKAEFNPFEEAVKEIETLNEKLKATEEIAKQVASIETQGIFGEIIKNYVKDGQYVDVLNMIADQLKDPPTYQTTVDQFLGGDKELAQRIIELATPMLQEEANPARDNVYNKLVETHKKVTLKSNTLTGDSFYEINGKQIKNRVTDKVKTFYEKTFKANQINKTEAQEAIDEYKRDKGTKGHSDMEALFHRYVDDNGYKRATPLDMPKSQLEPENSKFIEKLDKHMKDLIESYPEGTRFLSEIRMYNPSADQAGTMDFVAVKKDGTVDIRDWKFMDIKKGAEDVPWYKKEAFNIQLSEYKNILKKNYGVTKFGQTRAIPIRTQYSYKDWQNKTGLYLKGIAIGNVNVSEIADLTLLPVATRDESTGVPGIDTLIKKLNALYEKLRNEKVEEGRRDLKRNKLNALEKAIRVLQIQKGVKELAISATSIISTVENDLAKYTKQLADNPNIPRNEIKQIAARLIDDYDILDIFKDVKTSFRKVELSKEDAEKLDTISRKAAEVMEDIAEEGGIRQQVAEIIANGYNIKDLLSPEKVLTNLQRNFRSLSQAGTNAARVLWKMQERIKAAVAIEYDEEVRKIQAIKNKLEDEAKAKGISIDSLLTKMLSYKNKRWTGKLISKIKSEFYSKLKEAQKAVDKKWITENIDVEAYNEWYAKKLIDQIQYEEAQTYDWKDHEANVKERKRRIQKFKDTYSLTSDVGFSAANDQLLYYPKRDLWKSDELKEVEKFPALKEFYDYWEQKMKDSHKSGMIQGIAYNRFVPNIKRSLMEKHFEGVKGGKKKHLTLFDSLLAEDEDVAIDPLTGKPVQNVTPLFLYDLGQRATNDQGEEYIDYSQKSDDLFKILALWTAETARFKLRTEMEAEAKLIQAVEWRKGHLVDKKGHVVEGNETNAQYFDNFMNAVFYGRKYTGEGVDAKIAVNVNKMIRNINAATKKTLGHEFLPETSDEELQLSGTKIIEKMNRWFQMKVLGFNVPSALTNYLGGKANAYINAGKDFTKADMWLGETLMASGKFNTAEGEIVAGLIKYFMPLTDDDKFEKARALSVKGFAANLSSDFLFTLQRNSTKFVEIPIAIAYFRNTMVENGNLVNIRDFVKKKNGYDSIFQLPREQREALKEKIEKEIDELKNTRSLLKTAKVVNDELVIDGIQRNSNTVYEFRNKIQQFSKDALGNMDSEDIYQYRMSILMKSMMMFKNWIPRMADVRFGGLRKTVGKDEWEWGRFNMLWNGIFSNMFNAAQDLIGMASGQESLIERAKKLYIIKRSEFGEGFMSEAEFVEMYVRGAQQLVKELLTWLSMAGVVLSLGALTPDDDDEVTKGAHKWALRLVDKGMDELSFFYNPISMTQIANGSIFPAMGVVVDIERFAQHALTDGFYFITQNEEGMEKTKTVKYLFKSIPITKEFATYMALFSKEFSDDYGIQVSSQARQSR
jgi:hypothetical protein